MQRIDKPDADKVNSIISNFIKTRKLTEDLVKPLETEDYVVQATEDASPAKWHLGHTTWFFDKLILSKFAKNHRDTPAEFDFLFNSYYETLGHHVQKNIRGVMSRPLVSEIHEYRKKITADILNLLKSQFDGLDECLNLVELGINHEQQHQELLLMDIKILSYLNDGRISYPTEKNNKERNIENKWVNFKGGIKHIGHDGVGFAYDNEKPVHKVFLEDFSISANTVTIGDYLEFIADGGYEKPELWLSSGWDFIKKNQVNAPLYWIKEDDKFRIFKLSGYEDMDMNEPVSHISYYEADAYARWKGARLPKEEELELAGHDQIIKKNQNFMDKFYLSPISANEEKGQLNKLFGDVWEWTASSYLPYPGGKAMEGNLGEYNFKFMSNQFVLRGGSCLTPMSHFRNTYRNFYPPDKRWQMAGLRLARDSSAQ